jgi:uncharacterized repeat protein (TIGR03803 family)
MFNCRTLSICAVVAMLAGCGGTQPPFSSSPAGLAPQPSHVRPAYSVLYSFKDGSGDGANPYAGLINVNGTFYGTTPAGGANGDGTVFSMTTSGMETVLYRFKGGRDGAQPWAGLLNVNGTLYGTTAGGGANNDGTVFSITPSGKEKVLHSFGLTDGHNPVAGLLNVNGTLYGTTTGGGANNDGTVFSITPSGKEIRLYSFGGIGDGAKPWAGLVNVKGTLYGTTYVGGAYNVGTVFAITKSFTETVLHSFKGSEDGAYPEAGLLNVKGTLYGTTTSYGGGVGAVFSVTTSGTETVLYSFKGSKLGDGGVPYAGLIDVKGTLYGTTVHGGTHGDGTVFSMTTSGTETVLYRFKGSNHGDGDYPTAPLLNVNGTLYGTTYNGGNAGCDGGCGTVFSLSP